MSELNEKWLLDLTIESLYRRSLLNKGRIRAIVKIAEEEDREEEFSNRVNRIEASNQRMEQFMTDLRKLRGLGNRGQNIKISEEIAERNKKFDFMITTERSLLRRSIYNKGRIRAIAKIAKDENRESEFFYSILVIGKSNDRIERHIYDLEHIIF